MNLSRWLLASTLALAAPSIPQIHTPASAQTLVLRGARVIDGTGANPLDNAAIVISGGRIAAVGPAGSTAVPADAELVDYTGKTIIPGLISGHSHVGIFVGRRSLSRHRPRCRGSEPCFLSHGPLAIGSIMSRAGLCPVIAVDRLIG